MDAVMLAALSRLASLSTETETKTVNPEQLANLLAQLRWLLTLPETLNRRGSLRRAAKNY
ncbi:hypothetical protein O5699_25740 [Escherichia coli]|nr:hypothetical protein [Escherichia coli]